MTAHVRSGPVSVAAIDLGASSGRVMHGEVGDGRLTLKAVARFANDPVRLPDGLHWNVLELYAQAVAGVRAAVRAAGRSGLASVGVDSWAVDYGLLRGATMLGTPFHYRDGARSAAGPERVHGVVERAELYERNGLQFLPFNTLYQLAADPLVVEADHALLIPDLLAYWLTGELRTERTNASTTGLLDVRTQEWDEKFLQQLGLPEGLFPPLIDAGTEIGAVLASVGEAVGAPELRVIAVGSHDTASAVVGVPMSGDDAAYISCGTWGLVGVELDSPVITAESRAANFTNEGGVDGRTRFLTNVMGTWMLSECMRVWERRREPTPLEVLLAQASAVSGPVPLVDVQDPRFVPPGDMPARVVAYCEEHGMAPPASNAAIVRCIVESLAVGFAQAVEQAEGLSRRSISRIHVVGGGSRNALLCQSLADRSGRVVVAGPVEATALGNVLVQGRALGAITGGLESLRELVARTHDLETYRPRP